MVELTGWLDWICGSSFAAVAMSLGVFVSFKLLSCWITLGSDSSRSSTCMSDWMLFESSRVRDSADSWLSVSHSESLNSSGTACLLRLRSRYLQFKTAPCFLIIRNSLALMNGFLSLPNLGLGAGGHLVIELDLKQALITIGSSQAI